MLFNADFAELCKLHFKAKHFTFGWSAPLKGPHMARRTDFVETDTVRTTHDMCVGWDDSSSSERRPLSSFSSPDLLAM